MAGPWVFSTLVGLSVLVQLCNARVVRQPSAPKEIIDPKKDLTNHLLRRITGNVRRISDMLAFQILDQEDQRTTLEEKRASMNPKRKCILQSLILGKPVGECADVVGPKKVVKSTRRSLLGLKKRRTNNNADLNLNSNRNTNINNVSSNEDNDPLKTESPIKKRKLRRPIKTILKESFDRSKSGSPPEVANTNFNENINTNFNDEINGPGGLNDENNGLDALSDNDDGAGALNDEIDGLGNLNDETDGLGNLNDETDGLGNLNDETDGLGALNDEDNGAGALNDDGFVEDSILKDEDEGPVALNDEDYAPGLNDEEQLADEFEKYK